MSGDMADDDSTDEHAALAAHAPAAGPSAPDLAYFSTLDAPRWAVLLAAVGLACAGVVVAREAVRVIVRAFGH